VTAKDTMRRLTLFGHRRKKNWSAIFHNKRSSEQDYLAEVVHPRTGERYPNFPKTLHEVREWNGKHFDLCEMEQRLTGYSSRDFLLHGLPRVLS